MSVGKQCEKRIAQKKFKSEVDLRARPLDIEFAHADNADCHHKTLGNQLLSSTRFDKFILEEEARLLIR
jgi:hypothetical protein